MAPPTWILVSFAILLFVWCALLFSVFSSNRGPQQLLVVEEVGHGSLRVAESRTEEVNVQIPSASKGMDRFEIQPKKQIKRLELQADPPSLAEIERNMTLYLRTLHSALQATAGPAASAQKTWDAFFDVTTKLPMHWDDINQHRHFTPRDDDSIFVALGTYRDPYCPMTMKSLYGQAEHPEKVFVGLFQQNCFEKVCRTGVLKGGKVENMEPDVDCYKEFCKSPEGQRTNACNTGNVRLFNVNESESLGPYMARYLGGKFYRGEQYYLQIDSHSEFTSNWDSKLIKMVHDAPARLPVISTYPPDSSSNWKDTIGYRMCDSEFASAQIEWQIIRLGSSMTFDRSIPTVPCYAPFVAAGFFFGPASLLYDVPFDPLLPWIFMGEEISMSARLWTAGYDIFSPTINVLNHYYVRRHYPKFWESVNRFVLLAGVCCMLCCNVLKPTCDFILHCSGRLRSPFTTTSWSWC